MVITFKVVNSIVDRVPEVLSVRRIIPEEQRTARTHSVRGLE